MFSSSIGYLGGRYDFLGGGSPRDKATTGWQLLGPHETVAVGSKPAATFATPRNAPITQMTDNDSYLMFKNMVAQVVALYMGINRDCHTNIISRALRDLANDYSADHD